MRALAAIVLVATLAACTGHSPSSSPPRTPMDSEVALTVRVVNTSGQTQKVGFHCPEMEGSGQQIMSVPDEEVEEIRLDASRMCPRPHFLFATDREDPRGFPPVNLGQQTSLLIITLRQPLEDSSLEQFEAVGER